MDSNVCFGNVNFRDFFIVKEVKNSLMLNVLFFVVLVMLFKLKVSSWLMLFNCGFYFVIFRCFWVKDECVVEWKFNGKNGLVVRLELNFILIFG